MRKRRQIGSHDLAGSWKDLRSRMRPAALLQERSRRLVAVVSPRREELDMCVASEVGSRDRARFEDKWPQSTREQVSGGSKSYRACSYDGDRKMQVNLSHDKVLQLIDIRRITNIQFKKKGLKI